MVTDGTGIMEILWFGMPYIKKSLKIGEEYLFYRTDKEVCYFSVYQSRIQNCFLGNKKKVSENEILPIYSSNKKYHTE